MNDDTSLERKLRMRSARIAVVGLGYAGLPMAVEFARAGFVCVGLDVDPYKVKAISGGLSPVSNVGDDEIASLRAENAQLKGMIAPGGAGAARGRVAGAAAGGGADGFGTAGGGEGTVVGNSATVEAA